MAWFLVHHWLLKGETNTGTPGIVAASAITDWRSRTIRSVSIWTSIGAIRQMGELENHVYLAHKVMKLDVEISSVLYSETGEWRELIRTS